MNFQKGTLIDNDSFKALYNENDCAILTAWRDNDGACGEGKKYSLAQKRQMNIKLEREITRAGYEYHRAIGVYHEDHNGKQVKVKEDVFIVISDGKATSSFHNRIKQLGKRFKQDSVLLIKKRASARLVGTSKCKTLWILMNQTQTLGKAKFGTRGENYTILKNSTVSF